MNRRPSLGLRLLTTAGITTVAIAGVVVATSPSSPPESTSRDDAATVGDVAARGAASPPAVTRTSGDSRISIPQSPEVGAASAALRDCAKSLPSGAGDGSMISCTAIDELPDGTMVTMRCWQDGEIPRPENGAAFTVPGWDSPRWFLVTSHGGRHPGWNGYVYSGNIPVDQQVRTPNCFDLPGDPYPIGDPHWQYEVEFAVVGTCTTDGGVLRSASAHFTPGATYQMTVTGPHGQPVPVSPRPPVNTDGTVTFEWDCRGDQPGIYTVTVRDNMTYREVRDAHFVVGNPPPPPTTDASPPPTTGAVTVTVLNQVTNGPTQMRDDKPTYLSTVPRGHCKDNGCALPETDMTRGTRLDVVCQTTGEELTNGERNNPRDDSNPGLATSDVWYKGRWPDGREGYISVVWLAPSDRDGRGLPSC